MNSVERGPQRISSLDGLRGWAALSVVVFHLTWETFGGLFPIFRAFPSALVGQGSFAVALFLMVSGYVLTIGGWRNPDKTRVRLSILKRYLRLTIPILAAVLIFWAVLALGWSQAQQAGTIVQRPDWLGNFGNFKADLADALRFGLWGVYLTIGPQTYGPFLWTMQIELWWSLVVLGLCWFELPRRWAYLPLVVIIAWLLCMPSEPLRLASCYAGGALVALAVKDGLIPTGAPGARQNAVATAIAAVALAGAAMAQMSTAPGYVTAPIAMVGFVAVLRSTSISRLLSSPLSQWLGRISFPLYLSQIVVIVTVTSWLIVWVNQGDGLNIWTAAGIATVSSAACLIAAQVLLPFERLALDVTARLGTLVKLRSREVH